MKLLILGHGQHGKDTAAQIINDLTDMGFCSSSVFAFDQAIWPALKYDYLSETACYEDRRNRRSKWRQLIAEWCNPKDRLASELLEKFDIYVGMRHMEEYGASKHLFDYTLWIDRSKHVPSDPSMDIKFNNRTMYWIDNNGPEKHTIAEINRFFTIVNS